MEDTNAPRLYQVHVGRHWVAVAVEDAGQTPAEISAQALATPKACRFASLAALVEAHPTATWQRLVDADPKGLRIPKGQSDEEVLKIIEDHGVATPELLRRRCAMHPKAAWNALHRLEQQGKLKKLGKGVYVTP